jgi:hypothetical protein
MSMRPIDKLLTLVGPFSARTLYTVCKSRLFAAALLDPTERRNFLGSRKG